MSAMPTVMLASLSLLCLMLGGSWAHDVSKPVQSGHEQSMVGLLVSQAVQLFDLKSQMQTQVQKVQEQEKHLADLAKKEEKQEKRLADQARKVQEQEKRLADLAKKEQEQEKRLEDLAKKEQEQEKRLADVAKKEQEQEKRLADVAKKEQEQEKRLANLAKKEEKQDSEIKALVRETSSLRTAVNEMQGPCHPDNHTVINDTWRLTSVGIDGGAKCDNNLHPGWYRFVVNGSNAVIPTSCVQYEHCQTVGTGWLDLQGHSLPPVNQELSARVCYHWTSGRCQWQTQTVVRNCGSFYVYHLQPPPTCNYAHCVELQH